MSNRTSTSGDTGPFPSPISYGEPWCQLVPQGSTSSKSTPSCAVSDVLRTLGFPVGSSTRVCDEVGVGSGELDGVLLRAGLWNDSSERSGMEDVVAMGGKEGENTEGGLDVAFR